uniref:IAA-alanine resistance protein 1 n=1 Tax=Ananas comosus var. bracteatus TaxID=296719 RepID=A0A6V7P5T3_ANACO|nr:unnamed protein product [Ananas comosus var. bracteatus]
MPLSSPPPRRGRPVLLLLVAAAASVVVAAHTEDSGACPFSAPAGFDHHHHHDDHHHHHHHRHHDQDVEIRRQKLPEELAEEEDLMRDGLGHNHHHHHHDQNDDHHHHHSHGDLDAETSPLGVWLRAMGCSLLVSMASLICLILLPLIFFQGKPSKGVVDSLALFGAGAMLGDAFLHQLPHAFGGGHSHSHDNHDHQHDHGHSHAHSLQDLSIGLSILFGIVLFFLVEKVVRYVEDNSRKGTSHLSHGHHHHHHHHKHHNKVDDDDDNNDEFNSKHTDDKTRDIGDAQSQKASVDEADEQVNDGNLTERKALLRKRSTSGGGNITDGEVVNAPNATAMEKPLQHEKDLHSSHSNLVFGYLNLFSDGVHNFTDGMALGSAFLLHGSVGGWSRTLFLLAHELPQEVGDFGILVRSGFTVSKALFLNFLSALVALAGTALALVLGKDPGHSSLIEGFTAGGFVYIAVAGVLPEMNDGKTTIKSTVMQLMSLLLGTLVALCISLVE